MYVVTLYTYTRVTSSTTKHYYMMEEHWTSMAMTIWSPSVRAT